MFLQILLLHSIIVIFAPSNAEIASTSSEYCTFEGGIVQMTKEKQPKTCNSDLDCLPPANCLLNGKICCVHPLSQESPPVGCPKGTRQLYNNKGEGLSCSPTKPGSCPGGAICYEDSLEPTKFRCCGKDPSEGCGTGQRVMRHGNGSSMLCTPGDGSIECPGNAICEWSFAIDRFQCCEPDNGCHGADEIPLFDSNGDVLLCSPSHPKPCPANVAFCRFNFWIADFQCCVHSSDSSSNGDVTTMMPAKNTEVEEKKDLEEDEKKGGELGDQQHERHGQKEECPQGEIPYTISGRNKHNVAANDNGEGIGNGNRINCTLDDDCPPMAHCHNKKGAGHCCGPPGECPRPTEHPIFDEQGNILLCSFGHSSSSSCPPESKCRSTFDPFSGLPTGQTVCCGSFAFRCAASGVPFPNEQNPLRCQLDNPITCPMDMLCQASNMPDVSICCRPTGIGLFRRNLCPRGWNPYGHLNIFCHPTMHGSCPGHSACILSPTSGQFVCCQPIGSQWRMTATGMDDANGNERRLKGRRSNNDDYIGDSMLNCPNANDEIDTIPSGYPMQCTMDRRIPCRKGFLCQPSAEDPFVAVCCSQRRSATQNQHHHPTNGQQLHRNTQQQGGAIYRCPTATQMPVISQGQNVFCDIPGQQCPSGSSCQSALNSFAMMICCRNARQNSPFCPEGMRAETSPIGYVLCEQLQPNQCAEGFQCVRSRDDPEQNLCCAKLRNARPAGATTNYICPNQQVLYRDGSGPRFCPPNGQSGCPRGYSCEEALNQPGVFVCCSVPAQPVCPAGFDVALDLRGGNPIYCSPSDQSMCPAEANCVPAENRANTFLCCLSREPGRICPQPGQHALLQPNGQPEQCSGPGAPCSKPSYSCQLSYTLNNRYVCCGPPGAAILCADGRETYQQELGRTFQCNPISLYSECPAGFECALANLPNMHVCCRRVEAPQPTPQAPTDLGPALPMQPTSSVTFRPPVDELSCPVGWSAFEDQKGAHHFCQDALDMTCPHGFSCAQSSVNGIFMCCRLASAIQCPQAYSTLMVNNNPRLCSIGQRQTTSPNGNNIGGGGGVITSPSSSSSSAAVGTSATAMGACPSGYTCMQSSVPAVYVCCGSNISPSPAVNPFGGGAGNNRNELSCSDGQIPAYYGQFIRFCSSIGQQTECPPSYVCAMSNRPGLYVCCHPFPIRRRSPPNAFDHPRILMSPAT